MNRNIELNEEQKLNFKSEILPQHNSLLDIFDTNILSKIFIQLTIPIISEEEEEKEEEEEEYKDYKSCYLNCISFSLISKIFNSISKQLKFSISIFNQEKIENIDFNIYLKLNYILQQETCSILDSGVKIKDEIYKTKEELLNNILLYTSENGIYNLIPILILIGANTSYEDGYENTPLSFSCLKGNYKTSKILIKYNANINFKDNCNTSILHCACQSGNLKLVKYLINEKNLDIRSKDFFDKSILFYACYSGNTELAKYLIEEKKLDFNIQDRDDKSILFSACSSGNSELVKYLIEEIKLDFTLKDIDDRSILFYACKSGNLELVKYLIEEIKLDFNIQGTDDNRTILFEAVESKNIELIDYLLSLGLDIDHRDSEGITILYLSCISYYKDLETMKYLILKGADLKIKYNPTFETLELQNIFEDVESTQSNAESIFFKELKKHI